MNQQQAQTPMPQKKPAVSKWLWITFIVIAILGGFFLAWYLLMGPGKATEAATAEVDPMADWLTYTSTADNFSIKYPKTWEFKVVKDVVEFNETGKTAATAPITITVTVNTANDTLDAIVTKLSSTGTPTTMKLDTASALKIIVDNITKVVAVSGTKIYTLSSNAANLSIFNNMVKTFKFTTAASAAASASTDLTYTNATYGFTLTFPASWKGYKIKPVDFEGDHTFYINMPSTDTSNLDNTTAEAGYFSPFAIGVYTLADWDTIQASDGPKATLIIKTDKYAFAWTHANGVPPSDWTKDADIKTIIASFKLQ